MTTCLHRFAANVFWKMPRYVNSTLFASSLTSVEVRPSNESCSLGNESPASLPVGIPSPSLFDPTPKPSPKPPASVTGDCGLTTLPVAESYQRRVVRSIPPSRDCSIFSIFPGRLESMSLAGLRRNFSADVAVDHGPDQGPAEVLHGVVSLAGFGL